jgi:hypothetical protein
MATAGGLSLSLAPARRGNGNRISPLLAGRKCERYDQPAYPQRGVADRTFVSPGRMSPDVRAAPTAPSQDLCKKR